jgi:hypothetical protein
MAVTHSFTLFHGIVWHYTPSQTLSHAPPSRGQPAVHRPPSTRRISVWNDCWVCIRACVLCKGNDNVGVMFVCSSTTAVHSVLCETALCARHMYTQAQNAVGTLSFSLSFHACVYTLSFSLSFHACVYTLSFSLSFHACVYTLSLSHCICRCWKGCCVLVCCVCLRLVCGGAANSLVAINV